MAVNPFFQQKTQVQLFEFESLGHTFARCQHCVFTDYFKSQAPFRLRSSSRSRWMDMVNDHFIAINEWQRDTMLKVQDVIADMSGLRTDISDLRGYVVKECKSIRGEFQLVEDGVHTELLRFDKKVKALESKCASEQQGIVKRYNDLAEKVRIVNCSLSHPEPSQTTLRKRAIL